MFDDLLRGVRKLTLLSILRGTQKGCLAMTEPEGTPQDADLDPKSSTDEPTADVNQAAGEQETTADQATEEEGAAADYQVEGEEKAAADYQTRLEEFDKVEASVPVVSLPVESRES
jgi:hypothetical protein